MAQESHSPEEDLGAKLDYLLKGYDELLVCTRPWMMDYFFDTWFLRLVSHLFRIKPKKVNLGAKWLFADRFSSNRIHKFLRFVQRSLYDFRKAGGVLEEPFLETWRYRLQEYRKTVPTSLPWLGEGKLTKIVAVAVILTFLLTASQALSVPAILVLGLAALLVFEAVIAFLAVYFIALPEYLVYRRISKRLNIEKREQSVKEALRPHFESLAQKLNGELSTNILGGNPRSSTAGVSPTTVKSSPRRQLDLQRQETFKVSAKDRPVDAWGLLNKYSREDIQQIIRSIQDGSVQRKDIKLLLIELRQYLKEGEELKDITQFVAHPEGRDQGKALDHFEAFVKNFVEVSERGGKLHVGPAYSRHKVVSEMIECLRNLGFEVNEGSFRKHVAEVFQSLTEIMCDTDVLLKNEHVVAARTAMGPEGLAFQVIFKNLEMNPVLHVPSSITIAFGVFGD